jgi:hypothetical protein
MPVRLRLSFPLFAPEPDAIVARNAFTSFIHGTAAARTISARSPGWRNRQLHQLISAATVTNMGNVQKMASSRRYARRRTRPKKLRITKPMVGTLPRRV